MSTLRSRTIRLASTNPGLRPLLLPILKESSRSQPWKMTFGGKDENFVPVDLNVGGVTWTLTVPEAAPEPDAEQMDCIQVGLKAVHLAKQDPTVKPLLLIVDEYQITAPAVPSKPSFAVSANSRSGMLSKMQELGWTLSDRFGNRLVYRNPASEMTVVAAERDMFIIGA